MAAALAAASIVFKDTPLYSRKLITGATNIWTFARNMGNRARYVAGLPAGEVPFYNSTSYWDEYMWGGAWMFYATGNYTYLQFVTNPALAKNANANGGGPSYGVFSWDNKLIGAQVPSSFSSSFVVLMLTTKFLIFCSCRRCLCRGFTSCKVQDILTNSNSESITTKLRPSCAPTSRDTRSFL